MPKSPEYTGQQIVQALKERDERLCGPFFQRHYPAIEAYVCANNGTIADAEDVFNKVMITIYEMVDEDKLHIRKSFASYLKVACKNYWKRNKKKKINRSKVSFISLSEDSSEILKAADDPLMEAIMDVDIRLMIQRHYSKLIPRCRELIDHLFNNLSNSEIAERMNLTSADHVSKLKYKCIRKLRKYLEKDRVYQEMAAERFG